MSIEQGSQLGPYEIVGLIGRGGMGVVYRAHDARLARDVAIKVLPDELADDPERLRRFEREARAASSMSHPNILTVHDVGRHDGSPYLVTELLEGETLAERLSRGRLRTPLALEIATRIAEGLATAHSRGIVHRDLKPANVFLAADGGVKILDFGLAKLLPAAEGDSSKLSRTTLTESFALMGTPAYMAPEQVAGGGADFRADQFALGCILYEMLSGERPFARENLALTLAAIAEAEPPDLSERLPGLPPPVRWVVRRCLEKEPARRYRDSGDLALDLTLLADRADELARWAETPAPRGGRARWPWVAAAGLLAVLAVAVWPRSAPTTPPTVPEVRLLTYSGRDGSPVVSPSGATVAFSSERDGRRRIWLKELRSGAEVPLTEGPSDDLPRYSPSGSEILFVRQTGDGSDLYRVPAVGGQPRRILADAHGGDWLPDGRRIVFVRTTVEDGVTRTALGSVGAEGSEAEILLSFDGPLLHHPRVSPDGSRVALTDIGRQAGLPVAIWLVELQGLRAAPLPGAPEIGPLSAAAWLGRGDALVYSRAESVSAQLVGSPSRVLIHPLASGRPRVVLAAPTAVVTLAPAGSGTLILDGRSARQNLLEQALDDSPVAPLWLTRGSAGDRQPAYSPDGRWIVFSSRRGGSLDLWSISTETGEVRRLTDDPAEDWDPGFSRDGRLLWSSNRSGNFEIWTAAADGTAPRQITSGTGDAQNPTATPDGEWLTYASGNPDRPGIFKTRLDGGEPVSLVPGTSILPEISPDGRYVAYLSAWGTEAAMLRVVRLADGGAEPFAVPLPYDPNPRGVVVGRSRWLPDGSGIAFVSQAEDGSYGVYLQPFEPGRPAAGRPRRLAGFDPDRITESFAISPDGRRITLAQWEPVSSLLWAENVPGIEPVERVERLAKSAAGGVAGPHDSVRARYPRKLSAVVLDGRSPVPSTPAGSPSRARPARRSAPRGR